MAQLQPETQRRRMAVPVGVYHGRAAVVTHEDGIALALWNVRNAASRRRIRDGARYKPRDLDRWLRSVHAKIGDEVEITFARLSPHVTMILTMRLAVRRPTIVQDA